MPHMAQHGSCSLRMGLGTAWHSQIRAPWAVGGGQGEQQKDPSPRPVTPRCCLLLVTAECTQLQTPTTTPSAPPPRTASAPW